MAQKLTLAQALIGKAPILTRTHEQSDLIGANEFFTSPKMEELLAELKVEPDFPNITTTPIIKVQDKFTRPWYEPVVNFLFKLFKGERHA